MSENSNNSKGQAALTAYNKALEKGLQKQIRRAEITLPLLKRRLAASEGSSAGSPPGTIVSTGQTTTASTQIQPTLIQPTLAHLSVPQFPLPPIPPSSGTQGARPSDAKAQITSTSTRSKGDATDTTDSQSFASN